MRRGSLAVDPAEPAPHSMAGIITQNTLGQVGARVLSLLASFVALPILTRYLGPALFGEYSLVLTFNAMLLSLTDLGIQTIATREATQHPDELGGLAHRAVILRSLAAVVLTALSLAILSVSGYPVSVKVGFAIIAPTVLFNALATGFAVVLQTTLKLYVLGLADMLGRILTALLLIAAAVLAAQLNLSRASGLTALFVATLVGGAVPLVVVALAARRPHPQNGTRLSTLRLFQESLPLGAVVISSMLIYRLDTVILSVLRGSYDVGIYNVAYRFQDFVLLLPAMFMASVFPMLSAQLGSPAFFRRTWQRALDTLALVGAPIAGGMIVAAPQLVALFSGPQFAPAVLPLQVLSVAVFLSYLNFAFAYSLVIARLQLTFLVLNLVGVVLNAGLNLALIPSYSYNAAAAITVVSELVSLTLAYIVATRAYGYSLGFGRVVRALIAAGVMLAALYPIRTINLVLLILAGAVIYGAGLSALRVLRPGDVLVLWRHTWPR